MRLFVAIQLSEDLKKTIASTMHEMKKAGVKGDYVPKQNLHLTVAFIGEVETSTGVKAALENIAFKPFRISINEIGSFGDLVYVGMKGGQGLSGLVKEVRASLLAAGIKYDNKKFTPHVTIIRKAAGPYKSVAVTNGDMMVKGISLMKSEEKNGKRVYTEIFSV